MATIAVNRSQHEINFLLRQFVYLDGGPKATISPYDIARHWVEEISGDVSPKETSKQVFKKHFHALFEWMSANHSKCPTKNIRQLSLSPIVPGARQGENPKCKVKKSKNRERCKVSTTNSVLGFVSKSQIDVLSAEFLKSFEWRAIRMMALKKHGAVCQCCGASPKTGAVMNVDHIKSRKQFPELALNVDNLQILCGECNHGKGNWDATDWR